MSTSFQFEAVDIERLRMLARLSPGRRLLLMLNARELAVGLKRGRLRRRYPDLDTATLNLRLLEELDNAETPPSRSEPVL